MAGLDVHAGGTWLGINDDSLVAGVLNRPGSLGPDERLRSRGELVLEALDHADASAAAEALAHIDPRSYRPFNLVVADNQDAYWIMSLGPTGPGRAKVEALPSGLSMITAHDRNDESSERIRAYLPRFRSAPVPDPDKGDWTGWEALLAGRLFDADCGPEGAMTIVTDYGFGTVSSSLIALPSAARDNRKPLWRFANGRPGEVPFERVHI